MSAKKSKCVRVQKLKDEIRDMILGYFYDIHRKARSLKSARKKISAIKKDLKTLGLSQQEPLLG